jgi:hypothetical protein
MIHVIMLDNEENQLLLPYHTSLYLLQLRNRINKFTSQKYITSYSLNELFDIKDINRLKEQGAGKHNYNYIYIIFKFD